jgi:nitrate/nitrite transport system substrate-binding protein
VTRELSIGITPLADCAPIAVALEHGHFAREGLAVSLSREPSWANIRDKLATGELDAAHMLAPMTLAASLGLEPVAEPAVTAFALGLGGNAITVSRRLRARLADEGLADSAPPETCGAALARVIAADRAAGRAPLRIATVFPFSMHGYELRFWLAASGVTPDRDVRLPVVPPPRMVAELEAGALDGFCVGEPWGSLAQMRGVGSVLFAIEDLWSRAPEKVLGVNARWLERNHSTHKALLRALLAAAHWCDEPENRPELARLLATSHYVDAPESALIRSLAGPRRLHAFHSGDANFPWRSHAMWIATQMLRWGQLEKPLDLRAAAARVYRADLYREAARELGLRAPSEDEKSESCGGVTFEPARAAEYAASFAIASSSVRSDELAAAQHTRD